MRKAAARRVPVRDFGTLRVRMVLALFTGAVVVLQSLACDSDPARPGPVPQPLAGTWGGNGIRLTAQTDGVDMLFDCAEGRIEGPILPDERGRFEVSGTYTPTPGPEPAEGRPGRPAQYHGRVQGKMIILSVTLVDTGDSIGAFDLMLGDEGRVVFCR